MMDTVSLVPTHLSTGYHHIWSLSLPSLLCLYICPVWVSTPCTWYTRLFFLILPSFPWYFSGRASMHSHTLSINIQAQYYLHARTLSRNICAHASTSTFPYDFSSILVCTSMCLFVRSCDSASISAHAPARICAHSGCSVCLSVVLPKTLL